MAEDFVRAMGYLTLGTRLKRLGEQMHADVSSVLKAEGADVPASLFPTLGALDRNGPMTVGELAASLGVAQPGVTRNVAALSKAGLVKSTRGVRDQRQTSVELTRKGAALVTRTKQDLWPRIAGAVREMCEGLEGPILEQLALIEQALAMESLERRILKTSAKGERHASRA